MSKFDRNKRDLYHAVKQEVRSLESEGYRVEPLYVEQLGTGKQTTLKVLVGPNTTREELRKNRGKKFYRMGYNILLVDLEDSYSKNEILNGINDLVNNNVINRTDDKQYLRSCY